MLLPISYSRKTFKREKTLVILWQISLCLMCMFSYTKILDFVDKTFADGPHTLKCLKAFSVECFPLFGVY